MTASYLVAIAVTDPSSGRVWTAPTGSSHYDLMVIAARELGDVTDAGQFLTSQEGYGTVLAPRPFPGDGELYPEHSK
jgi:hypothetical protein